MDFSENEEAINKAKGYLPLIIAIMLLTAGAYYVLNLPKPTGINMTATIIDGGGPAAGVTIGLYKDGELVANAVTDDKGGAIIPGIPGDAEITFQAADGEYGITDDTSTLTTARDGKTTTAELKLYRTARTQIGMTPATENAIKAISTNCIMPLEFTIKNEEKTEAAIQIVQDEEDAQISFRPPEPTAIPPETEATLAGSLSIAKGSDDSQEQKQITLKFRVKETNNYIKKTIAVNPPSNLQISPRELSASTSDTVVSMQIRNDGRLPIAGINRRIQITEPQTAEKCGEFGEKCIFLDWPRDSEGTEVTTLLPGYELIVPIKLTPPGKTGRDEMYLGTLVVNATCLGTPGVAIPFQFAVPKSE